MPIKQRPHFRIVNDATEATEWQYREYINYATSRKVNGKYTAFLPVEHRVLTKAGAFHKYFGGTVRNWCYEEQVPWSDIVSRSLSQAYLSLDFQDNNTFELIPFLMDWDATLAMFSKKFIRELSYGAVTWGVLPFLSDLKSLVASLDDIQNGIAASYNKILGKRITRRFPVQFEISSGNCFNTVKGHATCFGLVSGTEMFPDTPSKALNVLLDEIGLNLDLKTAWDVIPFSFVVDYFLPIGDFLESLSPRGWFNPSFTLTGGYSIKVTISQRVDPARNNGYDSDDCVWTYYVRSPGVLTLESRPTVEPKFESPSFKQLFNAAYLGTNLKNIF